MLFLCVSLSSVSQNTNTQTLEYDTRLYLETNINFATSSGDKRSDAQAGTGSLGLKFERGLYYGGVKFTVFSKQNETESENSNDIKIFGSNLLIPSNSSESISSFSFLFGIKSFVEADESEIRRDFFHLSRFGGYTNFSINKTVWLLPDNSIDILINSWDIIAAYRLLTLEFQDDKNGSAILSLEAGYSNRRLGGNYGMKENVELRSEYIGTDELGFDSFVWGARLQVSDFYGEVSVTNFGDKGIPGFSGNQAVINLGFNAQLNLKAKEKYDAIK